MLQYTDRVQDCPCPIMLTTAVCNNIHSTGHAIFDHDGNNILTEIYILFCRQRWDANHILSGTPGTP